MSRLSCVVDVIYLWDLDQGIKYKWKGPLRKHYMTKRFHEVWGSNNTFNNFSFQKIRKINQILPPNNDFETIIIWFCLFTSIGLYARIINVNLYHFTKPLGTQCFSDIGRFFWEEELRNLLKQMPLKEFSQMNPLSISENILQTT